MLFSMKTQLRKVSKSRTPMGFYELASQKNIGVFLLFIFLGSIAKIMCIINARGRKNYGLLFG